MEQGEPAGQLLGGGGSPRGSVHGEVRRESMAARRSSGRQRQLSDPATHNRRRESEAPANMDGNLRVAVLTEIGQTTARWLQI
jgi:hypothetical protein